MRFSLYLGLLCVLFHQSSSLTCAECTSNYEDVATPGCQDFKNYTMCLETATECPLAAGKATLLASAHGTLTQDCVLTTTCGCQVDYWTTDLSANDTQIQCDADKVFLMCLKSKTNHSCNGLAPNVVARNHIVDQDCSSAFTDTCKCEVDLAKSDMSSNANMCGSYKSFLSCLKTATGQSCDGSKTANQVADEAYADLQAINPQSDCVLSPTCECEIDYAKNDTTDNTTKCVATGALVKCLQNETEPGCVPSTTVASLLDMTAMPVSGCDMMSSKVCRCEMDYIKGVKTTPEGHCRLAKFVITSVIRFDPLRRTAKKLLTCLYNTNSTEKTCDGSPKDSLHSFAKDLVTKEITGCELNDTCACEEKMKSGTCPDLKNGIACLRTAKSRSCDGVKIVKTLAEEAAAKIPTFSPSAPCSLEPPCSCELNYTSADASTDAKRCMAAETMKSCLKTAKTNANGADLRGCDNSTTITKITSDMDTIIAKCGAMQICGRSMTLVFLAAMIAHVLKN